MVVASGVTTHWLTSLANCNPCHLRTSCPFQSCPSIPSNPVNARGINEVNAGGIVLKPDYPLVKQVHKPGTRSAFLIMSLCGAIVLQSWVEISCLLATALGHFLVSPVEHACNTCFHRQTA